jgi:multidrug transporter EmrE-like cation transporter
MKLIPLLIVFGSVLLTAGAQLALKIASGRHADSTESAGLLQSVMQQLLDPLTVAAIGLYVGSLVLWLLALRSLPLSLAYPFSGLTIAVVAFLGWAVLNETLSVTHIVGMVLILIGVVLLAQSGG